MRRISGESARECGCPQRHASRDILGRDEEVLEGRGREWKDKTQWHNVVGLGKGLEPMAGRLIKGAHVFVQGELSTREYDRTIMVPAGKGKSVEHVIQQLVVELRAETIRILDRSIADSEQNNATRAASDEDIPA